MDSSSICSRPRDKRKLEEEEEKKKKEEDEKEEMEKKEEEEEDEEKKKEEGEEEEKEEDEEKKEFTLTSSLLQVAMETDSFLRISLLKVTETLRPKHQDPPGPTTEPVIQILI